MRTPSLTIAQNAELSELTSHTSDAYLRHLVYVKGALAVGTELAALLERLDDFLQREQFLLRPTVRAPGPVAVRLLHMLYLA